MSDERRELGSGTCERRDLGNSTFIEIRDAADGISLTVVNEDTEEEVGIRFDFSSCENLRLTNCGVGVEGSEEEMQCKVIMQPKETKKLCDLLMKDAAKGSITMNYKAQVSKKGKGSSGGGGDKEKEQQPPKAQQQEPSSSSATASKGPDHDILGGEVTEPEKKAAVKPRSSDDEQMIAEGLFLVMRPTFDGFLTLLRNANPEPFTAIVDFEGSDNLTPSACPDVKKLGATKFSMTIESQMKRPFAKLALIDKTNKTKTIKFCVVESVKDASKKIIAQDQAKIKAIAEASEKKKTMVEEQQKMEESERERQKQEAQKAAQKRDEERDLSDTLKLFVKSTHDGFMAYVLCTDQDPNIVTIDLEGSVNLTASACPNAVKINPTKFKITIDPGVPKQPFVKMVAKDKSTSAGLQYKVSFVKDTSAREAAEKLARAKAKSEQK